MSLSNVVPGRYTAQIKDWGIQEKQINDDDVLEAWISFDFKDQAGAMQSITWKRLILKKDGDRNKNVNLALEACGMELDEEGNADMVKFMGSDALKTTEPVDITIVDQEHNGKTYKNVEWVNKVGGGQVNKMTGEEKLSMEQKLIKMGLGKKKPKPKNRAPGADAKAAPGKGTAANDDEELNF